MQAGQALDHTHVVSFNAAGNNVAPAGRNRRPRYAGFNAPGVRGTASRDNTEAVGVGQGAVNHPKPVSTVMGRSF